VRVATYVGVWAALVSLTGVELALLTVNIPHAVFLTFLFGSAFIKAVLIALFYQHLVTEPKSVGAIYLAGLLTGLGLIVGMIVSMAGIMHSHH